MLTTEQREQIDRLLHEIGRPSELAGAVRELTTPQELFYLTGAYNWDDGLEIPGIIADHPQCDRAVALRLFWLAEAITCYDQQGPPSQYQEKWFRFCKLITQRLIEGYYPLGPNTFDPALSRVQRYKYEKQGISHLLLEAVTPSP